MSWNEVKIVKPVIDGLEAAAKAAQPKARPLKLAVEDCTKAPKKKTEKKERISIEFSESDYKKVMKKLDGRPANSNLSKIILEAMFGDKK